MLLTHRVLLILAVCPLTTVLISQLYCAIVRDINGIMILTAGVSDESSFSALKTLSNIASQAGYSLGMVM